MTPDQFVKDAVRTESRIEKVTLNPEVFEAITDGMIAFGNMLDAIKKHTFYKKPYDVNKISCQLDTVGNSISNLNQSFKFEWPLPQNEQPTEYNTRIFHAVIGIATEAVELLEALQRGELDEVNLREEFGDLLWYIAIGVDESGGNLDHVMDRVIAKLRARFPDKFDSEQAINRDLEKERAILEGKE